MSASTPEVTIVVPTRNRCRLLFRHALPSALAQEDVRFELVVVDDGSTDETASRLAELRDSRVRVVRNDPPRRLPGARNVGIGAARGPWVAFLDDDDVWAPRKLRHQLDAAAAAGCDWVYGAAVVTDERLRVLEADPLPRAHDVASLLRGGNWIPGGGSNVVARTALVRDVGCFDPDLRFFEDWDLWLRLVDQGPPAVTPEVVMARVEHGSNMVVRDRAEVLAAFERMMGRRRRLEDGDRLAVAEWLAHEQHRAGRRLAAASTYLRAAVAYRSPGNVVAAGGALLGARGLRAADTVLRRLRGASHLGDDPRPAADPDWLRRFREAAPWPT